MGTTGDENPLAGKPPHVSEDAYRMVSLHTPIKFALGRELFEVRRSLGVPQPEFADTSGFGSEMLRWLEFGAVTDEELRYYLPRWVETLNSYGQRYEGFQAVNLDAYLARIPAVSPSQDDGRGGGTSR